MPQDNRHLLIDLGKVVKEKSPSLARIMPKFAFRWLEKLMYIDQINEFLLLHGHKKDFDYIDAALAHIPIHVETTGLEHIPNEGGVIIASNHPIGGPDAMALMQQVAKVRKDQAFLVNDVLMAFKAIENLFVPVNKLGKNSRDMVRLIDQTFASEQVTLIFPAGLVSRKQPQGIEDLDWHKSFIRQSVKHKRDIIPVFIDAQNTPLFYNVANWRKRLKIKANLEMLFLSREMFKQANKTIHIYVGEPISWSTFNKEKTADEWARLVKKHTYQLPKGQLDFQVSLSETAN